MNVLDFHLNSVQHSLACLYIIESGKLKSINIFSMLWFFGLENQGHLFKICNVYWSGGGISIDFVISNIFSDKPSHRGFFLSVTLSLGPVTEHDF